MKQVEGTARSMGILNPGVLFDPLHRTVGITGALASQS